MLEAATDQSFSDASTEFLGAPTERHSRLEHGPDQLVHWLLSSLKLETSVFHVGQYCGNWRASTSGRALASYHLVLRGRCFVHFPERPALALGPRDGVFFLRDVPHFLSASEEITALQPLPMQPLSAEVEDGVALACGFFRFHGAQSDVLLGGLPDYLVIRADAEGLGATRMLFDLILAEPRRAPDRPSPIVARLADLLFFYVLRHVAQSDRSSSSLWAVTRQPAFAALVERILKEPGRTWSVETMARESGMSRASFFKHFVETSGLSPAQFLTLVRMRIAARRLHSGEHVGVAAEHVGYQSLAAFSRVFKKVIGEQPSSYRRAAQGRATVARADTDF